MATLTFLIYPWFIDENSCAKYGDLKSTAVWKMINILKCADVCSRINIISNAL